MRHIKLSHEVVHARYDEPTGKWHVRVRRPKADALAETEEIEDTADLLLTAYGALSRWNMPEIPGLENFKGVLHHSAGFDPEDKSWEEVADQWRDKRVGVVGVVRLASTSLCGPLLEVTALSVDRARARCRLCLRSNRAFPSSSTMSAERRGSLFRSEATPSRSSWGATSHLPRIVRSLSLVFRPLC